MKKNVTYYYDEDDAIPIKRKKKGEIKKREAPGKDAPISFTPRKMASDTSTVKKAVASDGADRKAVSSMVKTGSMAAVATETKVAKTVKADAAAKTDGAKAVKAETTANSERIRTIRSSGKAVEVAEIPYNREIGRVASFNDTSAHLAKEAVKTAEKSVSKKADAKKETTLTRSKCKAQKSKGFRISFIIYTVVLLILSASALLYVRGLLLDYEAAQPENIVQTKIDEMKKAFEKGNPEKAVSMTAVTDKFSPDENELNTFFSEILNSEITYKKVSDSSDPSFIAYDILSDKYPMARLEMRSHGKQERLVIFTTDIWVIEKFEVTGFTMDINLPSSLTVKNGDVVIEGVPAEDGKTSIYSVSSLTMPEITFTDVMGTTKSYSDSGEYKFTEYLISIPSNYTLKGKDVIPLSVATLTDIDQYKYTYEYCAEMPKTANYNLCIMADEISLTVLDNNGCEVDISTLGNSFTLEGQKGSDKMPENIKNAPDPLEMAKIWSLFMTDDLGGKTHGFYNMEKHLIADSYLHSVAWEWATGVDITFTSPHTLAKKPFTTAQATNFVAYSDTCFSCDVLLEKPMYIKKANTVIDKIYSTFYFVYCDDTDDGKDNPHWAIADIQKIAE